MPKDFTSDIDAPRKPLSAVGMQEGSIQLDSDSNNLMNGDADIIRKAYEDLIEGIFENFYQGAFVNKPTSKQLQQAETNFQNGIMMARKARDRAIALLPP